MSIGSIAQAAAPARGAPLQDVLFASLVGAVLFGGVLVIGALYVAGRLPLLDRLSERVERASGLPGWAAVPFELAGASLAAAVFGFYWDVSWHIDRGRDPGPFANPAHWFIFIGLGGIALAGAVSVLLGSNKPPATAVRIGRRLCSPIGGLLLLLSGGVALLGFPLDDVWHRLFGQDVTLWGPTHIQMIAGASLATLALLVLESEARRTVGTDALMRGPMRARWIVGTAGFLVGLSTLQAEFDFGVPQFRQLFHPILIMLAAGIALVAVRIRGGRGSALGAAVGFLAIRGVLTLLIGPGLGRSVLHFPLYLPEAVLVELVALRIPRERPLRLALTAGVLIGTVGLAAEWGWSHLFMPLPWHLSLLPEAAIFGLAAAVAGSVVGALVGRALAEDRIRSSRIPVAPVVAVTAAILICLAYPLPMTADPTHRATVTLQTVTPFPHRTMTATVHLDPPGLADHADWFNVTAWQGARHGDGGLVISDLEPVAPGVYHTTEPFPVDGEWKALIRLETGNALEVVPVYMPLDPAIPANLIPATPRFTRHFVRDKTALQREAAGGSSGLQLAAYIALALIAVSWLAAFGWGLRRLRLTSENAPEIAPWTPPEPSPYTVRSASG
ncbi:MAG: hypothetical protein ABR600_06610 [Actinomycetota bacterium]